MKKIVLVLFIIIFFTGCNKELDSKEDNNLSDKIEIKEEKEEVEEKEEYIDYNPIKIGLYQGNNGKYKRQDVFNTNLEPIKDIGVFSIILDNKEEVTGKNYKSIYKELSSTYENFSNYKIGYNISCTLKDGKEFNETILKPLKFSDFSFYEYLYIWFYDDINNSGYYSHIEMDDYNESTVMSSIKLMSSHKCEEIEGPISLTVFTYDLDDFDELGNYRGISKFTMLINREEIE